jgi:hypothetical protein
LTEQLQRSKEEGRLHTLLASWGDESRELRVVALGACRALFPRGVHDNTREVNEHL